MMNRKDVQAAFACDDDTTDRIMSVQAAGARHGRAGWYPNGDFSSDSDFCNGTGAEIQRIEEALNIDDGAVFDVYAEAHSEASPPRPELYEVEFSITTYPEETSISGNVLASGDAAEDRKAEDDVRARLAAGDEWAWCAVKVTATYEETTATAWLGCVSYESKAAFLAAEWANMKKEAYNDLLGVLAAEHAANAPPACESCGIEFSPVEGRVETYTPQCNCNDCTDEDSGWTVQR